MSAQHGGRTGLVADPIFAAHNTGPGHPECPARIDAVLNALSEAGLLEQTERTPLRSATRDEILLCHTEKYLRTVEHDVAAGLGMLSTGDTNIGTRTLEIALLAAGSVLSAVDEVVAGRVANAFCIVRPPGHHATQSRGMGFCVFNNVALAARYAQKKHGIGNVLIVDWDVHHGNGTEQIFYGDDRVFYFSTHLYPWYPGTGARSDTGAGQGIGFNLNAPFPVGTPAEEVVSVFQNELVPRMKQYQPQLVLISAGFDSRVGDPLGGLQLTDRHFADLTLLLCGVANEFARGRLVSVLEGGYSLDGLAKAAVAHVKALMEGAASACT